MAVRLPKPDLVNPFTKEKLYTAKTVRELIQKYMEKEQAKTAKE